MQGREERVYDASGPKSIVVVVYRDDNLHIIIGAGISKRRCIGRRLSGEEIVEVDWYGGILWMNVQVSPR